VGLLKKVGLHGCVWEYGRRCFGVLVVVGGGKDGVVDQAMVYVVGIQ
jgi:hypothetical protein